MAYKRAAGKRSGIDEHGNEHGNEGVHVNLVPRDLAGYGVCQHGVRKTNVQDAAKKDAKQPEKHGGESVHADANDADLGEADSGEEDSGEAVRETKQPANAAKKEEKVVKDVHIGLKESSEDTD